METEHIADYPSQTLLERLRELHEAESLHDPVSPRYAQLAQEAARISFELMWREGQWKA